MTGISNISRENYTKDKIRFIKELQTIIRTWIRGNKVRTVASLARGAKVSDVSVRRLLNNDRKIVNESVFNIISWIYDQSTFEGMVKALEKDDKPIVLEWFIKYYSYMRKYPVLQENKYIPVSDVVTGSPMAFFGYLLTLVLDQVSRKRFQQEFGGPAIAELDKLIKKCFLQEIEGMVSIQGEAVSLKFTKEQVAYLLPELCKMFFKPDHDFNAQHLEVGALSKEGYNDLRDFHLEFLAKIQTLYRTKPGNIPVISAGFSDTFTSRPYFTNEGEKNGSPQKNQS